MILEKVKAVIAENLNVDVNSVALESQLKQDLGADSLDAVELTIALEDAFDIKVDDEAAAKFITVQDIVTYIESLN